MRPLAQALAWVEARASSVFGPDLNPAHWLGALCVYCFWIALVTGIYLFVFYDISLSGAWKSVDGITHGQRYVGGIMRSLHRYASDAAVLLMTAHFLREFIRRRFHGPRWFSWFTGVPLIFIVMTLGISGYWMVWDELAQYVAVSTARLLDVLPVFTDPMSRNFLDNHSVSERFFTLIAFIHLIGLPIVLVLGLWFHLLRIRLPRINPPRLLMGSCLAAFLALSLLVPATSHAPANLDRVPEVLDFDWYYLAIFPFQTLTSETTALLAATGFTLLLAALPWLWRAPKPAVAVVHLPDCTGCGFCAEDCPYGAIDMVPRTDGRNLDLQAQVNPSLCVGCGICTGSCPSSSPFRRQEPLKSGIEIPVPSMEAMARELKAPPPGEQPAILLVACEHAARADLVNDARMVQLDLPCAGMAPPAVIDYALRNGGFDGVVVSGCEGCDCWFRYGNRWTTARFARERPPMLRERVPRERIRLSYNKPTGHRALASDIAALRTDLAAMPHARQDES